MLKLSKEGRNARRTCSDGHTKTHIGVEGEKTPGPEYLSKDNALENLENFQPFSG